MRNNEFDIRVLYNSETLVYKGVQRFLRRRNKKTIKHMKSIAQTVKRVIMNLLKVLHNSQIKKIGIY